MRCPKCGSSTEPGEMIFSKETLTCNTINQRRQKIKVFYTFEDMEKIFNEIMGDDIKIMFEDPYYRYKLLFMMKSYVWVLLRNQPQLWQKVDVVILGLKELMTLRMDKGRKGK